MWPASERLKATNSLCVSGVSQVSTELLAECCSYATLHLFRSAAATSETVWQDLVLGLRYWVMHYTHTHTHLPSILAVLHPLPQVSDLAR